MFVRGEHRGLRATHQGTHHQWALVRTIDELLVCTKCIFLRFFSASWSLHVTAVSHYYPKKGKGSTRATAMPKPHSTATDRRLRPPNGYIYSQPAPNHWWPPFASGAIHPNSPFPYQFLFHPSRIYLRPTLYSDSVVPPAVHPCVQESPALPGAPAP